MSQGKVSALVFSFGLLTVVTTLGAFAYTSTYSPTEEDKKKIPQYDNRVVKSNEFQAFFDKMKNGNDPQQQKVFDGKLVYCIIECSQQQSFIR